MIEGTGLALCRRTIQKAVLALREARRDDCSGSLAGVGVRQQRGAKRDVVFVLSEHASGVGGPPESTTLLCEMLVTIGVRVCLFTPHPPKDPYCARLQAAGVKVTTSFLRRGSRWRLPQKCVVGVLFVEALWRRPALVYGMGLTAQVDYLLRLPRVAPVIPWENTEALPHAKFVNRGISRRLHKAAGVIAPTRLVASNVRATYDYAGPVYILPFWVSEPQTPPTDTCDGRTNNLLYIGRYDLDKGFEYLFAAFERVSGLCPRATLTLHGSGATEALAKLGCGNPAIRIRGPIHGRAFEEAFRACDAVVLPSVSEGYPLCLLDACARGKPVVASRVGAVPELFEHRACALLVAPRDVEDLARALITVLGESDDSHLRRRMEALRFFAEVGAHGPIRARLAELHAALTGHGERRAADGVSEPQDGFL